MGPSSAISILSRSWLALGVTILAIALAGPLVAAAEDADPATAQQAVVDEAMAALEILAPTWDLPPAVSDPLEAGDLATAAQAASLAQRWVENAFAADEAWPELGALERSQADFESAESRAELEAGAELAESWKESATHVGRAIEDYEKDRDILGRIGSWGVDLDGPLQSAKDAALAGDVAGAISWSSEVSSRISNGTRDGSLRLAGLVFLGIAVLGVLGLWVMLRRRPRGGDPPSTGLGGPPWATSG